MKYLITGGTGTFGRAVLESLLRADRVDEIRIFSRDESKQDDMRNEYTDERVKFFIGDVRDKHSIYPAMLGVDYVFHAAAMKQIGSCERFPTEAVKTNVHGTANVIDVAVNCRAARFVLLSSDKAVNPMGVMGMTKALAESIMRAKVNPGTVLSAVRFGNLINSRNSVVPLWRKQMRSGDPVTITDWKMTRFMMTTSEAVELVFRAFRQGLPGEVLTMKSPACTVRDLYLAVCGHYKPVRIIGVRDGERMHEYLTERYSSDKARRLTIDELKEML